MGDNILSGEELIECQKETAEMIKDYLTRLIPGMKNSIAELKGDMKEDSWEYLRMIIDGFNWVIEAYNGVSSYVNPDKDRIDESAIESAIAKLGKKIGTKNEAETADILENDIVPFLEKMAEIL